MFSPKWKSEAKHLVKGSQKYLQYKRDLLSDEQIGEIESRRQDLISTLKTGDRATIEEAAKQLRAECENALPREKPIGWLEENVEVMFVAIVIALGLRAYYVQPFRIPTGSMQPTLNGITGTPLPKSEWPTLPQRLLEKALRGRTYVHLEAKQDMRLRVQRRPGGGMEFVTELADAQFMHFFSRSVLRNVNGDIIRLPAPATPIYDAGLATALGKAAIKNGIPYNGVVSIPKGTVLCEGYIDTGDLVLVNKFSYHFRKPTRGEVFVFDTLGITGIDIRSGDQAKGSHYIKRLCGVPGDSLTIDSPYLLVDGKIAKEPSITRIMDHEGPYSINNGYQFASPEPRRPDGSSHYQYLDKPDKALRLDYKPNTGHSEYAALGDNTGNSLDSRYWGPVKEFNLVGPALFSLWPITTGHWGFID